MEFKFSNFAKLFHYNVFFGNHLQYIIWAMKISKTVETYHFTKLPSYFSSEFFFSQICIMQPYVSYDRSHAIVLVPLCNLCFIMSPYIASTKIADPFRKKINTHSIKPFLLPNYIFASR